MHGNSREALKEKAKLSDQGLKRCGCCEKIKPLKDFPPIGPTIKYQGDGLKSNCRKCESSYGYALRRKNKQVIRRMKLESGCIICGYDENPILLYWHHRDPAEKLFTIGVGPTFTAHSLKKIIAETKKCDVLCQPCHMEHHSTLREI